MIRGRLQRKRYCGVLTERLKAREQKKRIEHFSTNFEGSCVVRRITLPDRPVAAWKKRSGVLEREGEGKKRLELALQLREMYQAQQNEWERFRQAEGQRRIDKANRLKAEQLAMILARSQERRRHIEECNTYTTSLRVQTRAAMRIQRAYRHWKRETACRRKLLEMLQLKKRACQNGTELVGMEQSLLEWNTACQNGTQLVGMEQSLSEWNRACRNGTQPVGMEHSLSEWNRACRNGTQLVGMEQSLSEWNRACWNGTELVGMEQSLSKWNRACRNETQPVEMEHSLLEWNTACRNGT